MRLLIFYSVYLFLILFIASYAGASVSKELNNQRNSRSAVYFLRPARRIGRSDTSWNVNQATSKRKISKLMAFPRVGRGNARTWLDEEDFSTPNKRNAGQQGMWFGPRLGRVQKRNALDSNNVPQTYIIIGGEDLAPRGVDYTPRLGRESEENFGDDIDLNGSLVADSA